MRFWPFLSKIDYLRPTLASRNHEMNHFHEFFHKSCALRYIGGVLELRKIGFSGLKGQLDVKNANFMGLIAKNSYLWPILAYRTHLWPIFMDCAMGIVT